MVSLDESNLQNVLRAEFTRAERMLVSHEIDVIDDLLIHLECLYGYLIHINDNGLAPNVVNQELVETTRRLINCLKEVLDNVNNHQVMVTPLIANNRRGRPQYDLPMDQLIYLVENGFTGTKISQMFGISLRTVYHRMSEYGICIHQTYSDIADSQLKELITEAHLSFPNAGYRFIRGWLMQKGL